MRLPDPARLARRLAGGFLLAALFLPLHRLLDPAVAGPAAEATVALADGVQELLRWGTVTLLLAATVLALLLPIDRMGGALDRSRALLVRPAPLTFGMILYTAAFSLGATAALGLHHGLPRLLDEMAQLLHARHFAAGQLTGPIPVPAGRLIQNSLLVEGQWASVYPPGHTALLALGHLVDAPWVVGPFLLGVTALFTFLAVERLYPARTGTARLAGLLVAFSPFLVFLGSGYLSHVSVAAAAAVTLYFTVRSWRGASAWAILAGVAAAYGVAARPWTGLLLGAFLTGGVLLAVWWREGRSVRWLGARGAWGVLGASPILGALFWYDTRLFGGPFTLGYERAFGPAHGLGFHVDPWGNAYGLREAVGYTAADVGTLGLHLFETPLPALALVGVFLLLVPRLSPGTRILLGWALLPVAASFLYWHHGQHMGPRMLLESAPAWAALAVVSGVGLVEGLRDPGAEGLVEATWSRRLPPSIVLWVVILAVPAGVFYTLPARLEALRWDPDALVRSVPPEIGDEGRPALVFVHGSWAGRVGARLAAAGMRRDSVETALRRNGLCRVHLYERARSGGTRPLPELDLEPRPGSPTSLVTVRLGGTPARLERGPLDPSCVREAASDRFGSVEIAPLLWQTGLPETGEPMLLYRDLGPEGNAEVVRRFPERVPYVFAPGAPGERPALIPYEDAMEVLWRRGVTDSAGRTRISGRSAPARKDVSAAAAPAAPGPRRSGFPGGRSRS